MLPGLLLSIALLAHVNLASAQVTVTLGQDVNYPPYASKNETTGELIGLGVDIASGMNALCTDVQINVVETRWGNCWSDAGGGTLGELIADGSLDGCMTYTHTQGIRDQLADFSGGILSINKAAGFITRLIDGQPWVAGRDDLSGKNIVDVGGWAPTADTVSFVENKCTDTPYASDYNLLVAPAGGDGVDMNPNDIALKMILNDTADVMYVYADQASNYNRACRSGDRSGKDCDAWSGFGTTFGYIGTGKYGYMVNGTTLILSRKGSGVTEQVEPCLQRFMATRAYYDICVKYGFVSDCFPNQFFPSASSGYVSPYNMPTDLHSTTCGDGYCGCDATAAQPSTMLDSLLELAAANRDAEQGQINMPAAAVGAGVAAAFGVLVAFTAFQVKRRFAIQQPDDFFVAIDDVQQSC